MAETIIFEDATRRDIKATSDGKRPDDPGYWESFRTEWKAGSVGANRQTIEDAAANALAANRALIQQAKPGTATAQASAAYDAVVALARQQNGIIRLLLNRLDGTN